jgi:NACalpha-BTF3-like transcription factor
MGKMGLKQVSGINRVTIKKGKAVHFYSILVRYQHR